MNEYNRQQSDRSHSAPSSQSSLNRSLSIENIRKVKKSGVDLVKKVFQVVVKKLKGDQKEWNEIFQKFVSDGYEDLNQASLARVSDLMIQYKLDGKQSIYLYLEIQKEYKKLEKKQNLVYPNTEEIQSISHESLDNLLKQPAEIQYISSQQNKLPLNLIILFGPKDSGKTTFISACINFIRGLDYHSLLRYTVQKNERIINIENEGEQYCFIKAQSITNPYNNRKLTSNLLQDLVKETSGRTLQSFSILYFALSTQTRIGLAEKYQVQKILEIIPYDMIKFFIVKTFCTDDRAKMVIFTGEHSPARMVPLFIQKYVQYANTQDQDKEKYIFNNKLLSYEYKNKQNIQNQQNVNYNQINQVQPGNNLQNSNIQQNQQQNQNQIQAQTQSQEQQNLINQEQEQQLVQNQFSIEQMSQSQSVILDLSIDNVDMTQVYWVRNEKNYKKLSEDIKEAATDLCQNEFNQFKEHLQNLQKIELNIDSLMAIKKEILSKQQQITQKIDKLQNLKTEIQNIYISILSQQNDQIKNRSYANTVNILICTQCEQVCHQACSSKQDDINKLQYDIPNCNRFKKGFCKSCYKNNKNQNCRPVKHKLVEETKFKDPEITLMNLNIEFFKTKNQQASKEKKIQKVRFLQKEVFDLQKKYVTEIKKFKQDFNQNQQTIRQKQQNEVQGYLKVDFEIYKKLLDQQKWDIDEGLLYHFVINDL